MIVLAPNHLKRIADAAEAAWPAECCGLLVGAEGADGICRVACVVASRNLALGADGTAARDRFEVDPAVRLRLHLQLRGSDRRIVGLYHSHPGQPAQPSQRDLDAVLEPELIWLIVSVVSGQAVQITAHRPAPAGDRFVELRLRTTDWHTDPVRIVSTCSD